MARGIETSPTTVCEDLALPVRVVHARTLTGLRVCPGMLSAALLAVWEDGEPRKGHCGRLITSGSAGPAESFAVSEAGSPEVLSQADPHHVGLMNEASGSSPAGGCHLRLSEPPTRTTYLIHLYISTYACGCIKTARKKTHPNGSVVSSGERGRDGGLEVARALRGFCFAVVWFTAMCSHLTRADGR